MLVIADTTPLRYLLVLGQADLLHRLFGQIVIPPAVAAESQHPRAPAALRAWMSTPPAWLEIRPTRQLPDARLLRLDPGEREAILLAQELQADIVLMDDQDAREEAERRTLEVMGTLRVLELAAERGWIDLPALLTQLRAARFYLTPEMVEELLARDAARKARPSGPNGHADDSGAF
jgi:predicted nucleic acid-binding protein